MQELMRDHANMQLARSAGELLVMSSKARQHIPKLRQLFAERGADMTALTELPISSDREFDWDQVLDLGDMALSFDVGALLNGLETVTDFTSGDSNSDGGDGGGGDGGGD